MRRLFAPLLLLLAGPLGAQTLAQPQLPDWLAGAWVMENGAEWADEVWTDPRGGIMLGMARTGFGAELQSWEQTQIRVKADGTISFFAQPRGRSATEFPLALISAEAIEFANAAHDYPQRIRYSRQGKLLVAEISKIDGSRPMRWNYRPVVPPREGVE